MRVTIADISDERRAQKIAASQPKISKQFRVDGKETLQSGKQVTRPDSDSDKDVTEGRVFLKFGHWSTGMNYQYPHCVKHGAMNKLTKDGNIWRCSECGVGCQVVEIKE